jgi:hypothetical protein
LRMTILIDNHGKEVEGVDEADLRRAEEIFWRREPIYYADPKKANQVIIENWSHLVRKNFSIQSFDWKSYWDVLKGWERNLMRLGKKNHNSNNKCWNMYSLKNSI